MSCSNPKAALAISAQLMKYLGENDPNLLDLQGIAYAATGDFDNAIKCVRASLSYLKEESAYQREVSARLKLYTEGKPYREGMRFFLFMSDHIQYVS